VATACGGILPHLPLLHCRAPDTPPVHRWTAGGSGGCNPPACPALLARATAVRTGRDAAPSTSNVRPPTTTQGHPGHPTGLQARGPGGLVPCSAEATPVASSRRRTLPAARSHGPGPHQLDGLVFRNCRPGAGGDPRLGGGRRPSGNGLEHHRGANHQHRPALDGRGACLGQGGHDAARADGLGAAANCHADPREDDLLCDHASHLQS
jgi:hypothetical protein